jgi:hypothetical protein
VTLENESLIKEIKSLKDSSSKLRKGINMNRHYTQEAIKAANFNEQDSRKNNIKVFNFPTKPKQDLRKELVDTVRTDLGVPLDPKDFMAIHCIPTTNPCQHNKPIIVCLASSEVKKKCDETEKRSEK